MLSCYAIRSQTERRQLGRGATVVSCINGFKNLLSPLLPSSPCLFLCFFFPSSIGGERRLPSGLCRSSWRAPFEAFHSGSSSQDCTLLSWLCSINNSPPASLLPPSSFCSSPLSIYSCVRGGSVCACVWGKEGVRERELEVEWMREEMGRMLICMCFFFLSIFPVPVFSLRLRLYSPSLGICPLLECMCLCLFALSISFSVCVCVYIYHMVPFLSAA